MPRRVTARTPIGIWNRTPTEIERQREERVVLAGPDLDVELVVVEVQEELDGRRNDDEVGEDDPGDEEHRDHQEHRQHRLLLPRAQRRQDERVRVVEQDRHGDQQRAVEHQRQRGQERLGRREGQRGELVAGERRVGDVEQRLVLPEAERRDDHEGDAAEDQPAAQLVEVLDERHPVVEVGCLDPRHRWPGLCGRADGR